MPEIPFTPDDDDALATALDDDAPFSQANYGIAGGKEIGALAHLYRAEVYRSTIWRQRLDTTTNWAVITTGVAMSISYASIDASPLPIVLAGMLTIMFLGLEARRYQYFNVWRFRARLLEIAVIVPLLRGEGANIPIDKGTALSDSYERPHHKITFWRAIGRRLRRNYGWIFIIQGLAYYSKIAIHPAEAENLIEYVHRAHVGPVPGAVGFGLGLFFHVVWIAVALYTRHLDRLDRTITADSLG